MVKVRLPCQAGAFYEDTPERLRKQIEDCFLHELGPGRIPDKKATDLERVVGLVCPHAGYMFSGPVAAHAYMELALDGRPDTVVVLGPNHTGYGSGLAIMNTGLWRTPLGDVAVDSQTANEIVHASGLVDIDESAHKHEHSVEVQLPFLQFLYGSRFSIVPVCFLMHDLPSAKELGKAIGEVLTGRNAVVIASSDMTHYEPQKEASRKDMSALKAVEELAEERFHSIIETQAISACGYGPISSLITASKTMGAKKAKLLSYRTSGDLTGDYSSVVGYGAVSFEK